MEVYLYESTYDEGIYQEIYLRVPGTRIMIGNDGLDKIQLEAQYFTNIFWDMLGVDSELTYIGEI